MDTSEEYHQLEFHLASSHSSHGMVSANRLLTLVLRAIAVADVFAVLVAHDLCKLFVSGARADLIATECRQHQAPYARTSACKCLQEPAGLPAAPARVLGFHQSLRTESKIERSMDPI